MERKILSEEQIQEFIERGWTRLPAAYAREDALAAQNVLWEVLRERDVLRDDPSTWTAPLVQISESYYDPEFQRCDTPRLNDAIDDLLGAGRRASWEGATPWGWWPVKFPIGADASWDIAPTSWHWDGTFRHYVNSPNQGILLICCFSDVAPRGGGTFLASGSHQIVARYLASKPDGVDVAPAIQECSASHPWLADLTGKGPRYDEAASPDRIERFLNQPWTDAHGTTLEVHEATCEAGDVLLCHPMLYHSPSPNLSGPPRFMCNRTTPLREPLQLERPDGDYSVLEQSLRHALAATQPA